MSTKHETVTRYPLSWPVGWQRTPRHKRRRASFTSRGAAITVWAAIQRLQGELDRLGARDLVLSTNLRTRLDGLPYSDQKTPDDPGVAVYFRMKQQDRCLACDTWDTVAGNIAALAAHIDALRRIDRYGVGTIEQAFAGYTALPAPAANWRLIFGYSDTDRPTLDDIESRYKAAALTTHPDRGGSDYEMATLNVAIESARAELA